MDEVDISAAATSGGAAGETGAGLIAEQVQEGQQVVTPTPGARNYGYPDEFMMFAFKVNPSSALWPLMGHQLTSCSSTDKVCLQSTTGGKPGPRQAKMAFKVQCQVYVLCPANVWLLVRLMTARGWTSTPVAAAHMPILETWPGGAIPAVIRHCFVQR